MVRAREDKKEKIASNVAVRWDQQECKTLGAAGLMDIDRVGLTFDLVLVGINHMGGTTVQNKRECAVMDQGQGLRQLVQDDETKSRVRMVG